MIRKSVSFLAITIVGIMSAFPSGGVQMTSQIRDLLEQKDKKVQQLETCEGKKKGWMIAGISTIGLTAVGVGVNIAQANKSNNLSGQIDSARHDLEVQERRLGEVNSQISEKMNAVPAAQNTPGTAVATNRTSVANQNTGGSCTCAGCRKSLVIDNQTYGCGVNADEGTFAKLNAWMYVCNDGCWKGPDTVGYIGVPDCDSSYNARRYDYYMGSGVHLYFDAAYGDGRLYSYGITNICKRQD